MLEPCQRCFLALRNNVIRRKRSLFVGRLAQSEHASLIISRTEPTNSGLVSVNPDIRCSAGMRVVSFTKRTVNENGKRRHVGGSFRSHEARSLPLPRRNCT
eukprot:scaffold6963_cov175-Skeletonema_dohrnii-CCMP3373.AAC.2